CRRLIHRVLHCASMLNSDVQRSPGLADERRVTVGLSAALPPHPRPLSHEALVSTYRVFAGDSRSQAPPGNALPSRLCLDFRRLRAKFPSRQAEPAWHCVPRRSLGTRCVDTNAHEGRGERWKWGPLSRVAVPDLRATLDWPR